MTTTNAKPDHIIRIEKEISKIYKSYINSDTFFQWVAKCQILAGKSKNDYSEANRLLNAFLEYTSPDKNTIIENNMPSKTTGLFSPDVLNDAQLNKAFKQIENLILKSLFQDDKKYELLITLAALQRLSRLEQEIKFEIQFDEHMNDLKRKLLKTPNK